MQISKTSSSEKTIHTTTHSHDFSESPKSDVVEGTVEVKKLERNFNLLSICSVGYV